MVEIWCVCNHDNAGSPAWVVSGCERKSAKASMSPMPISTLSEKRMEGGGYKLRMSP